MQTFTAIALLALVSGSRAALTCEDCTSIVGGMVERGTTDESIGQQIELIVSNVCPLADDPAGCETGINTWWSSIAMAMIPFYLEPATTCGFAGACMAKSGEPTCEECSALVETIGNHLMGEAAANTITTFLDGDFCESSPDAETCRTAIDETIPYALPVLGAAMIEIAPEICMC